MAVAGKTTRWRRLEALRLDLALAYGAEEDGGAPRLPPEHREASGREHGDDTAMASGRQRREESERGGGGEWGLGFVQRVRCVLIHRGGLSDARHGVNRWRGRRARVHHTMASVPCTHVEGKGPGSGLGRSLY